MSKKLDNTTTRWVNYPGAKLFSRISIHIGSNELQFIHVIGEHKGEVYQLQIDHEEFGSIWKTDSNVRRVKMCDCPPLRLMTLAEALVYVENNRFVHDFAVT